MGLNKEELATAGKVLVLRTCNLDMTSYGGFTYPTSGLVSAPDWSPQPTCGGGLHGLLWGCGNGSLLRSEQNAVWMVLEVDASTLVDLDGKVKFPFGDVVYCGDVHAATSYIAERAPATGLPIVGYTATAGDAGTATAGYAGTATAGYAGILVFRYWDQDCDRWRLTVGYIGEGGLESGVSYRLNAAHEIVATN